MRLHLAELSPAHTRFFTDLLESLPPGVLVTRGEYWGKIATSNALRIAGLAAMIRPISVILLTIFTKVFPAVRQKIRDQLVQSMREGIRSRYSQKIRGLSWLFFSSLGRERAELTAFERDLGLWQPDVVFFADDSASGSFLWCSEAASATAVKTVVIPYVSNMSAEYRSMSSAGSWFYKVKCRLGGQLFPESTIVLDGSVKSLPFDWLARAAIHNVDSSNIWLAGTDKADCYLISHEPDHALLSLKNGPSKRYVLIEPPSATAVRNRQRERLAKLPEREVLAKNSSPKILVLVPPNQFPTSCGFRSYPSLLKHFPGELGRHKIRDSAFLVSVHPRDRKTFNFSYLQLLGDFRVVESVVDGFAEANMLINYGSSVETVSDYLGIPILSYNVYGFPHLDSAFGNSIHLSSGRTTFGRDFEQFQKRVLLEQLQSPEMRKSLWQVMEGLGSDFSRW